jgi:hypothetical protein
MDDRFKRGNDYGIFVDVVVLRVFAHVVDFEGDVVKLLIVGFGGDVAKLLVSLLIVKRRENDRIWLAKVKRLARADCVTPSAHRNLNTMEVCLSVEGGTRTRVRGVGVSGDVQLLLEGIDRGSRRRHCYSIVERLL